MNHLAYPTGYPLAPRVQVSILISPIQAGDGLTIEYPNNERAIGEVLRAEPDFLEIAVAGKRWRLVPLLPEETPEKPIRFAQKPVPVWVVQQKGRSSPASRTSERASKRPTPDSVPEPGALRETESDLDEALAGTFPASDPVAAEDPVKRVGRAPQRTGTRK